METTSAHDERIAKMTISSVYPYYLAKVKKKGRSKDELHEVVRWLTGFSEEELQAHISRASTFAVFFERANLNPNANSITGMICGYRIEDIQNPLTRKVRYLDKLVDELSRGKPMDRILRKMN